MKTSWTNESLHRHISTNFGVGPLALVRKLEKIAKKLANYRNHLRFNLRCRQNNVIPKSMKQKALEAGHTAEKYQHNYLKRILSLRIRRLHFKITDLKIELEELNHSLGSAVSEETFQRINDFILEVQMTEHNTSKKRQIRKFQNLIAEKQQAWKGHRGSDKEGSHLRNKDNWIKNLSNRQLSEPEKEVLSKGLNFSVTPKNLPTVDFITAAESAIRNNGLSESEAADLRLRVTSVLNNAKLPPSNITAEERKALSALQKDENIMILPADKGRCTVILNSTDYEAKVNSLLSDQNTYERLKRDPSNGYKKKIIEYLSKLEKEQLIDKQMYFRLYPGDAVPCIYGLPKIHKQDIPLRPIVCSTDSITYNLARHLKSILAPLVGNSEHHIENTKDFVDKIKHLYLNSDETMVSFDVTSLFTCIPTVEAVAAVKQRLLNDTTLSERTKLTPEHICHLLEICLNTTYFQFRGNYYRQISGCAMGSPVSPIVANLYMEEVEKKALASFPGSPPSHWFRYVDDTWTKIKKQEVEAFTAHINSIDPHIQFTREEAKDHTLAFLDCEVTLGSNRQLQTFVYRKPTHTDQYLQFDSNHPLQHKLGVIRTLQHRAQEVPTTSEGKARELQHVESTLSACGYPRWSLDKVKRSHSSKRQNRQETEPRRRGVAMPYVAGVGEKLQRVFRQHNIPIYFKPVNTLRQKLVHPKDKTPSHKQSNVVYSIQCQENCSEHYIGETKQPLFKRMAQHRRENSGGPQSAVHLHLKATNHTFEDKEVKILAKESNWFARGVKEACFVKQQRPSLNRGGGLRFALPSLYNGLLRTKERSSFVRDNEAAGHLSQSSE